MRRPVTQSLTTGTADLPRMVVCGLLALCTSLSLQCSNDGSQVDAAALAVLGEHY